MDAPTLPPLPRPHSGDTVRLRMLDAAIALLPAAAGALWVFRWRAALVLAMALLGAAGSEWLWLRGGLRARREAQRESRPKAGGWDGSGLVTGLLLGLLLPPDCPWWAALLGGLLASGSKRLCGGLGRNFLNPAALGRVLLLLFPALRPAPLREAAGGFLMGYAGGGLGEVSSLLLLAGAAYLARRRLLPWETALPALAAAFFTAACIPRCDAPAVLAWGGTALLAFFLTADPVTTPMGTLRRAGFGAAAAAAGTLCAYYGPGLAGVCGAVLAGNAATALCGRIAAKRRA